jgi:hypothetical protein
MNNKDGRKKQNAKLMMLLCMGTALCGCTHIEGTRDKSATFQRSAVLGSIDSMAILPVKDDAGMPGLSEKIEAALTQNLQSQFPRAQIVDAQTVASKFVERDLVTSYGQWRSGYEFTGMVDPRPFEPVAQALGTKYVLVVHSPHLAREKIRGSDTGYNGAVADANNVWRTDLEFAAELINTQSKQTTWKGAAHAEHIHSPKKSADLGVVIINHRNPEMPEYIDEMVTTATQGVAQQIGATFGQ